MYSNQVKPFAIYVNDRLHSRHRHYSHAEGVAEAMSRQRPNYRIGVWWDCAGVKTMFIQYGADYAVGVNHNVSES